MEENLATVIDWLFQLGVNEDGVNKSANEFIRHEYLESKSLRNLTQQMVLEKCPEFFNGLIINPSFHSILKKFAEVPNRSSNEERELANFCGILAGFVGIQSERKAKPRIELITAEIVMALQEMIEDTNTNTHSQTYGLREESLQILCESEATYFISVLFLHFIKQNVSNINYYVHTAEQSLDRRMKSIIKRGKENDEINIQILLRLILSGAWKEKDIIPIITNFLNQEKLSDKDSYSLVQIIKEKIEKQQQQSSIASILVELGLHDTLLRKHFQGENKKKNKDQQLENNDDNLGGLFLALISEDQQQEEKQLLLDTIDRNRLNDLFLIAFAQQSLENMQDRSDNTNTFNIQVEVERMNAILQFVIDHSNVQNIQQDFYSKNLREIIQSSSLASGCLLCWIVHQIFGQNNLHDLGNPFVLPPSLQNTRLAKQSNVNITLPTYFLTLEDTNSDIQGILELLLIIAQSHANQVNYIFLLLTRFLEYYIYAYPSTYSDVSNNPLSNLQDTLMDILEAIANLISFSNNTKLFMSIEEIFINRSFWVSDLGQSKTGKDDLRLNKSEEIIIERKELSIQDSAQIYYLNTLLGLIEPPFSEIFSGHIRSICNSCKKWLTDSLLADSQLVNLQLYFKQNLMQ